MPRRSRAKAETTLVQHRTPDLAALLDKAKDCELAPLKRFLAAGGQPDAMALWRCPDGSRYSATLLLKAIGSKPVADFRSSIELLMNAGAKVNAFAVNADTGEKWSLLMCACQVSFTEEPLKFLLQHGADACLQLPNSGLTALHTAATNGYTYKCKLLLDADRRTLELRVGDGRTAVFEATFKGHLSVVELLHQGYGADLFTVNNTGATVLHAAVHGQLPSEALLVYLLRYGMDINAVNSRASTPLHVAAGKGDAATVQLLLKHNADCNIKNDHGDTAMGYACRMGFTSVVAEFLVDCKLQPM
jgi:ankyrin repeat protein